VYRGTKQNPAGLGLVGDSRDYRLFKRLFRQLLQLKGITIKDLKAQIEQVNHSVMEKEQKINVQREFSEPYERVKKDQDSLRRLQDNQETIERVVDLTEEMVRRQGKLVNYHLKSTPLFLKEMEMLEETLETQLSQQTRAKDQLPEIKLAKEDKQQQISREDQRLGVINNDIARYEKLTRECNEITIEIEQQTLINLDQEYEELQGKLFNSRNVNLASLEEKLTFKQGKLTQTQLRLNNISSTLYAQLKVLLKPEELLRLYQVSNADLWGLLNEKQFKLHDKVKLTAFLKKHLANTDVSSLDVPGLRVDLNFVSATGLHERGNPDFLKQQIDKLTVEIKQLQEQITTIREQESIKKQITEIKQRQEIASGVIKKYQQWQAAGVDYAKWLEESEIVMTTIAQHKKEMESYDEKAYDLRQKVKHLSENIKVTKQKIKDLDTRKKWIETNAPSNDWTNIDIDLSAFSFEELYDNYRGQSEALLHEMQNVTQSLQRLRGRFINLTGMSDTDAIGFLREQLEAIPEKEKSINDEWKRIFTSFAAHCRGIIDSVDTIDSYLADLNRLLGRQTISNLQSIKIVISRNEWYRRILKIREWKEHDLPLFGGLDEAAIDDLMASVKPLLEKVNITVADLYDLVIEVVDTHGNKKQYQSLDLESNGTSITVKTIIFISMINQAISGKKNIGESIRLPFYVDEIDSLDDANAQNIHDIAVNLGLIPIFASPKGSGICKRLYQLENNSIGKLSVRMKAENTSKLLLVKPTFARID